MRMETTAWITRPKAWEVAFRAGRCVECGSVQVGRITTPAPGWYCADCAVEWYVAAGQVIGVRPDANGRVPRLPTPTVPASVEDAFRSGVPCQTIADAVGVPVGTIRGMKGAWTKAHRGLS